MLGRRKHTDPDERVPRKDRTGASPVTVGVLVLVALAVITFFGFTKHVPFTHGYRLKAVFESANSIRKNSPVRIAGVNVGKVKSIERFGDTDASVVTMEIDKQGLPIHKDAQAKIRPRIFLEGNFFVDVKPGTPGSPRLNDGDTIPLSQTAGPVQLDQVLTALQADTRKNLQETLVGLGNGLTRKPTAADDAQADPATRGETAAKSLNDSIDTAKPALKNTAIVSDAFLGTQRRDLSRLLAGLSRTTEGLSRHEQSLQDLITNFDRTVAATASQATNLRLSIRELGPTLVSANGALDSLNAAFPNTRAFARAILPGVRETNPTIQASFPWIAQVRPLVSQAELGGLVAQLSPATRDLAKLISASLQLLPQTDLAARCVAQNILPTGDVVIQDGNLSSGVENYKEFWYTMAALAGEGQNFDGNGQYVRFQTGGGSQTVGMNTADKLYGNAAAKPIGTRPKYPGARPPYKPDVPCYTQKLPDLNSAGYGSPDQSVGTAPGGATTPIPGVPLPTVPNVPLPAVPATGTVLPAARAVAPRRDLASQIASRLNPFRGATRAKKGSRR